MSRSDLKILNQILTLGISKFSFTVPWYAMNLSTCDEFTLVGFCTDCVGVYTNKTNLNTFN